MTAKSYNVTDNLYGVLLYIHMKCLHICSLSAEQGLAGSQGKHNTYHAHIKYLRWHTLLEEA